eukprot:GHUV01053273.1.p1 GENE.GHUV01053273.1~~GHUV01053273.1.p1  ORF type:complete len:203 (-),score=38.19 GHUV01053273.1:199-807(-)
MLSHVAKEARKAQRLAGLLQQCQRGFAAHAMPQEVHCCTEFSTLTNSNTRTVDYIVGLLQADTHTVEGVQPDYSYTPAGRNHLFVPGPVNIHERVLRAMDVPGQNHRDPFFAPFFKSLLADTKYVFQTEKGTPFIFTGTGTGGWEAALTNTLSPGDKVVTFRCAAACVVACACWPLTVLTAAAELSLLHLSMSNQEDHILVS